MKIKAKSIILSCFLCVFGFLSAFALAGCGDVSIKSLKENFDKLDKTYTDYSTIFTTGTLEDGALSTDYLVTYGTQVDSYVAANDENYVSLRDIYNVMLAISSDYIDNNKEYVLSLEEGKLSKNTKNAINNLNEKLNAYINYLTTFAKEQNNLKVHFDNFSDVESDIVYLRNFKKSYGKLIELNIDLSLSLAEVVETTEIFDLFQITTPTVNDTKVVKEYLRAKMLPIFSELILLETENSFNYSAYEGGAKAEIDKLLEKINANFELYKSDVVVVPDTKQLKALATKEDMTELLTYSENFFVEMDVYFKALEDLKIYDMVVNHKNDFTEHAKHVKLAGVYYDKVDQFISYTLDDYMDYLLDTVYEVKNEL